MKTYGLYTNDNELIIKNSSESEELSIIFFSQIKKLSIKTLMDIFIVKEVK
jgi:hypothetical protein